MIAFAQFTDSATVRCRVCGLSHLIMYHRQDMLDWLIGNGFIQDLMPYLSAAERELLISRTCGACFDKLFPPLDTNNDE